MSCNPLIKLSDFGQSVWLDYIKRDMITSGRLKEMIEQDGLKGMTSNPSIFEKAIGEGNDYDADIKEMADEGKDERSVYEALSCRDVQMAADEFRCVYEDTNALDGYVSLEVNPHLANDTNGTIKEARRLWSALDRPNVFIKVPSTREGLAAIRQLISDGININVTLLFGLPRYREVADAYIAGIKERLDKGESVERVASVASFFLSRIDTAIDPVLAKMIKLGGDNAGIAQKIYGQTAIFSAKVAYQMYKEMFLGERFKKLVEAGARPQRLLWASTSAKNPEFKATKYVDALIGPDTVNTMPPETIEAYRDAGNPALTLEVDYERAKRLLQQLAIVGIDIDRVTSRLESEGVEKFNQPFDKLMETLRVFLQEYYDGIYEEQL